MAGPETKVQASGSAGTQGATADVQGPQAAPADSTKQPEAKNETMQIHPFASMDYNFYDAGHGNDGLFSSGFGKLNDQTWTRFNLGATWNANANKVRFFFGPELNYSMLRGGPQTNESAINNIGIGPHVALDWNRAMGLGMWRLFDRVDLAYNIGYAWGDTTANPSIRKYEQSALSHYFRAGLEVFGINFDNGEFGLGVDGGSYIADGDQINNTGMTLGAFAALRLDRHAEVKSKPVPMCEDSVENAQYFWEQAKQLQAKNTKLREELDSIKGYLEARPKNPITVDKITKAQWLGKVEVELGKMQSDKKAEIEAAAEVAKKSKKADTAAAFKAIPGIKAENVDLAIKLADVDYPADTYNFYTHNLREEAPIPENLEQVDPKDCAKAKALSEEMRKIYEGYLRNNGVLTQKVDDIIIVAGLEGKGEVEQIVAASILDVNQPNFQTSRAAPEDVADIQKYVTGKTNLAADDAGLIALMNKVRNNNKAHRPTKVFGDAKLELNKLKELADWLNGTRGLDSAKDLEIKISGGDPKDQKTQVNESAQGIKKIREWQKTVKLKIEGHTDQRGEPADNQKLSQQRADAIRWILVGFGVAPERLEAIGYGEERPIAAETGGKEEIAAAQAKNRRVVFRLAGATTPSAPTVAEWGGKDVTTSKESESFPAGDEAKPGEQKPAPKKKDETKPTSAAPTNPATAPTAKADKAPAPSKTKAETAFDKSDL